MILCLYTLDKATSSELEIDEVEEDEPGGTRDDEGENMTTHDSSRTCEGVGLTCVRRADEGSVRTSTWSVAKSGMTSKTCNSKGGIGGGNVDIAR